MRRVIVAHILTLISLAACASPGAPPGAPPDKEAPKLVHISPDTNATNVKLKEVELQFDKVVSERPRGEASLEALFLISPRNGDVEVGWHRSRLTVRPRKGFRPNTVYTVQLRPGIVGLQNNVDSVGRTIVFSTGPTIPNTRITGIVFDWVAGRTVPRAMVEAIGPVDSTRRDRPDSVVYVAEADTGGRFVMQHLPPGPYTLRAFNDANKNRSLEPREMWDSAHVTLTDTLQREFLTFIHDTIGPGISVVNIKDSVTLRVTFDKPLDPAQQITASLFTLKAADSSTVAITQAMSGPAFERAQAAADSAKAAATADSIRRATAAADSARRAAGDTARARPPAAAPPVARAGQPTPGRGAAPGRGRGAADTAKAPPPKPSKPSPSADVVLRLAAPLRPATAFRLRADSVRNLLGRARGSERVFTTPKPQAPPDTTKKRPPADSARRPPAPAARPDTARRRP